MQRLSFFSSCAQTDYWFHDWAVCLVLLLSLPMVSMVQSLQLAAEGKTDCRNPQVSSVTYESIVVVFFIIFNLILYLTLISFTKYIQSLGPYWCPYNVTSLKLSLDSLSMLGKWLHSAEMDGWNVFLPPSVNDRDEHSALTSDRCFPLFPLLYISSHVILVLSLQSIYTLGVFVCCLASLGRIHTAGESSHKPSSTGFSSLLHAATHTRTHTAAAAVVNHGNRYTEALRSTLALQKSPKQSWAFKIQMNFIVGSVSSAAPQFASFFSQHKCNIWNNEAEVAYGCVNVAQQYFFISISVCSY